MLAIEPRTSTIESDAGVAGVAALDGAGAGVVDGVVVSTFAESLLPHADTITAEIATKRITLLRAMEASCDK
jgi:hypothetical protein